MSNLDVELMKEENIEEYVDIFINTFTKEPWLDTYESREQVVNYFKNYFAMDSFLGYVALEEGKVVAISVGMKKPWIEGIEYYIDEFCVNYEDQGRGIGCEFLKEIEKDIKGKGVDGFLLNTEKGYPSEKFYLKNGFKQIKNLIVLGR